MKVNSKIGVGTGSLLILAGLYLRFKTASSEKGNMAYYAGMLIGGGAMLVGSSISISNE